MRGTGSRTLLCKSSSLVFLLPSFSSTRLRLKSITFQGPSSFRLCRMATGASSSSPSLTSGDAGKPPATSANGNGADSSSPSSPSASSTIDFLSLCHRLKVHKLHWVISYWLLIIFKYFLFRVWMTRKFLKLENNFLSLFSFYVVCHLHIYVFVFFMNQTTKRAGWVRRDVKDPESVADHMYRMGVMALIASDIPGVDRDKLGSLLLLLFWSLITDYLLFVSFLYWNGT